MMQKIEKDGVPRSKQKLPTSVCPNNGIKIDVVVVVVVVS